VLFCNGHLEKLERCVSCACRGFSKTNIFHEKNTGLRKYQSQSMNRDIFGSRLWVAAFVVKRETCWSESTFGVSQFIFTV
jgi:hypothetical protein